MIPEPYPVLWAGQQAVVVLPDRMDLSNAADIRTELLAVINRGPTVMVADMSATDSCDHSGAAAVARAYQRAMVSGTDLRLVITSQTVRREITVSGLDWLVPVYHSLGRALASTEPAEAALKTAGGGPARAGARARAGAGARTGTARQPAAPAAGPLAKEEGPAGPAPPDPDAGTEIALLDRHGVIVSVNHAWRAFATANQGDPSRTGPGVCYLEACAAAGDDPVALAVAAAIRQALEGDLPCPLSIEVPCHSPDSARWFDMLISTRLDDDGQHLGATVTLALARWQPLAAPAVCADQAGKAVAPARPGGRAVRPVHEPAAAGEAGAAAPLRRADTPDRRAAGVNHLLVHRLFAAGLSLEAAMEMLGNHPASGRIQDAATDLDQAIRDLRSMLFDEPSP